MVRRFIEDAEKTLSLDLTSRLGLTPALLAGTVATGKLFAPILAQHVDEVNQRLGSRLKVAAVENRFFGEEVTVAGLLAGGDFLAARDSFDGDFVIVPEQACLKQGRMFLDNLAIDDLERELGLPVAHGGPSLSTMLEKAAELWSRKVAVAALA
jgi:NifB/MoaA-like Fe-S oxidoreductase